MFMAADEVSDPVSRAIYDIGACTVTSVPCNVKGVTSGILVESLDESNRFHRCAAPGEGEEAIA